ncbi:50S ribosomal protein L29 [Candidatus Woesebacteria bacterium]|nr:50S ribosomal protein L29 [Candidatus Woesebacteria bacterium]
MRTNDIKALHDKSVEELKVQLDELSVELAKARLQKRAGKLKNTHISLLADDVARIKTVIGNKS